eukprot:CAMPEP_0183292232 /NCGR_PEP_ID=MMETSP0160_2-20130417/1362_1 /TAXON_ID=2839 ORGANISM="Odontella Sinensis, Strain Grunow 1884" /NCGR_SAMPLE_ID=MMETSP0160_2 /ASSEMBLY_ACC=CAM_ASM_000250 /LENGTH=139 /DNA_ID=CAMNT_0025453153 /DNA_START=774 /DNA_END=1191 /DNA_ORIENTATION=-
MKVDPRIRVGPKEVHATIGKVVPRRRPLDPVQPTNVPNDRPPRPEARRDLVAVLSVHAFEVPPDHRLSQSLPRADAGLEGEPAQERRGGWGCGGREGCNKRHKQERKDKDNGGGDILSLCRAEEGIFSRFEGKLWLEIW